MTSGLVYHRPQRFNLSCCAVNCSENCLTVAKCAAEHAPDTGSCAAQCRDIMCSGDEVYSQRAGWRLRRAKWLRGGLMGDFQEIKKKKRKAQILVKNSAM